MRGDALPDVSDLAVSPGYFRTMGIPLAEGREFERTAAARTDVIINQPFARKQWPDGHGARRDAPHRRRGPPVTVVGITAKTHTRGLDREVPMLYVPIGREHFEGGLTLVVRTATAPASLVRPFVDAAQAVDPNVSMLSVKTMEQRMAVQLWPFRTLSWLFSICGGLALILATVGSGRRRDSRGEPADCGNSACACRSARRRAIS